MAYEEPHTHPLPKTLTRRETDPDVRDLSEMVRDILKTEELWYVLQVYKNWTLANNYLEEWGEKKENYEESNRAWQDVKENYLGSRY